MNYIATAQLKIESLSLKDCFFEPEPDEQDKKNYTIDYDLLFNLARDAYEYKRTDELEAECTLSCHNDTKLLFKLTTQTVLRLKQLHAADIEHDFYDYIIRTAFSHTAGWFTIKKINTWAEHITIPVTNVNREDFQAQINNIWFPL